MSSSLASIDVGHGQVDDAAMAPEASGVEGQSVRQKPELREDGVDRVPVHDTQSGKPELTPVRDSQSATDRVQESASLRHARFIGADAQQAQSDVVQGRSEGSALRLDVQTPSSLSSDVVEEVANDFRLALRTQLSTSDVARDD